MSKILASADFKNLSVKSNKPEFSIDTNALDRIDFLPLTAGRFSEIERTGTDTPTSFMNNLIAIVGRKNNGMELTDNDVMKLSDANRIEIAKKVLEFNQCLFRESVQEKRKDDEGRVIVSAKQSSVKHQKEEDESDSDYLFRLFKILQAKLKEQTRRMLSPFEDMLKANKRLFSPAFLEAFTRNQLATAQLGNMIGRMRVNIPGVYGDAVTTPKLGRVKTSVIYRPELLVKDLSAIRNPIHDTNERLSDVVNKLDTMEELALQIAEIVKSLNDSASLLLVNVGAVADKIDRSSRRAICIAVIAIVVVVLSTVVQIGYSEWRAKRDQVYTTMTINAISSQNGAYVAEQHETMARIEGVLNSGNAVVMKSFNRLSTAIEKLAESLQMQIKSPVPSESDWESVPSK